MGTHKLWSLLVCAFAASCSDTGERETSEVPPQLSNPASVTVSSSERPGAVSGVVASFATITTEESGPLRTIYVAYFDATQFLPSSGDRCRIDYVMSDRAGPMARSIQCSGGSWSYPGARRT